jgi:hypothetical protein
LRSRWTTFPYSTPRLMRLLSAWYDLGRWPGRIESQLLTNVVSWVVQGGGQVFPKLFWTYELVGVAQNQVSWLIN